MRGLVLISILSLLCVFTIPSVHALVGSEGTTFSSNGYETVISIEYTGEKTLNLVEGGGSGGSPMYSLMIVKVYDNTTNYPYVEIWDEDTLLFNFTMYEKEVARIWVNGSEGIDTLILITDMRGDKSAWINLVDYTCTGNEDIRKFWVYKDGPGFPDAVIRTWLTDCEQLIIPLYNDQFII